MPEQALERFLLVLGLPNELFSQLMLLHTHTDIHTHSGIIGSGLCVFSRHPIITAYSHQFTAGDGIYRFKTGEIFAGKGVMAVKITTPEGTITFYNTHVRRGGRERVRKRVKPLFCFFPSRPVDVLTKRANCLRSFNLLSKREGQTQLSSLVTSTPIPAILPTLSSLDASGYAISTSRNFAMMHSTSLGESRSTQLTTSLFLMTYQLLLLLVVSQHRYTKW